MESTSIAQIEKIVSKIHLIRGQKVILDKDLAALYGVSTSILNKAVSRNIDRFPSDFMFVLTEEEFSNLKFHFGTSSWGGTRKLPRAFTEQGVAMLSGVLKSKRAVVVNIEIMRAFVQLRNMVASQKQLAEKLSALEQKLEGHDEQIQNIFQAIRQLMISPEKPQTKIGFVIKEKQRGYAKSGSKIAGNARKQLEKKLGKSIVSKRTFIDKTKNDRTLPEKEK